MQSGWVRFFKSKTINSKYNRNLSPRFEAIITAFRLTATVKFLPIGVKATGVETKGKECGSGLSSCWWGREHCMTSPNNGCEGDYM